MKLLIGESNHLEYRQLLQGLLPQLELVSASQCADLLPLAQDCPIWLGEPGLLGELLQAGCRPRWLQSTWAGVAPLLAEGMPRDYLLSRAVGVFGQLMAEYLLGHMLAHERKLAARWQAQLEQRWDGSLPGSLAARRVVIVGCGDIGLAVARLLQPFAVRLLGIASTARQLPGFERIATLAQLPELVSQADYVINLLPDTAATRDIYGAALFACFKPTAVLINAGRGSSLVDADLLEALQQGQLAGAVLDVCREEPLAADHPFWTAKNLLLTGHSAAPSLPHLLVALFAENLQRYQQGMALRGCVDFSRGY